MLTHRYQMLIDQETMELLRRVSSLKNVSIGKLIRSAVKKVYKKEDPLQARKKALEKILKIRPPVSKTPIDYKELINYGRKY